MLKKMLALTLSAMMALSMGVTAFAATAVDFDGAVEIIQDEKDLRTNKTYNFDLVNIPTAGTQWSVDSDYMDNYSIKVKVTEGKNSLATAKLVKDKNGIYEVVVSTASSLSRDSDFAFVLQVIKKGRGTPTYTSPEYLFKILADSKHIDDKVNDDEWDIYLDERTSVEFDEDIYRCTLFFEDAAFLKMRIGNKSIYSFEANTKINKSVLAAAPSSADLAFLNFPTKTALEFTGTVGISIENGEKYAYSIDANNKLTDLKATKKDGYLVFDTSKLGNYVISSVALNATGTATEKPEETEKPSGGGGISPSTPSAATIITKTTLTSALNAVGASGTAVVNIKPDSYVAISDLKAAFQGNTGKQIKFVYKESNAVVYEYFMNYRQVSAMTGTNYKLGLDLTAKTTKALFDKYYKNKTVIVASPADINGAKAVFSVKLNLTGLNKNALKAYIYNPAKNHYELVATPFLSVDAAGYTHFTLPVGYDVIITDSVLTAK